MEIRAISLQVPGLTAPSAGSSAVGNTPAGPAGATGTVLSGFGEALTNAISNLSEMQGAADSASVQMAAGDPIDLHEVMLARETASLHFQLAVQVRNKLVEAYQDVMRMQV